MTTRIATAAGAGPDTRFFVPFTKVEENSDGSVYIEGIATGEVVDYHGEIVLDSASVDAFEEWTDWAEKASGGASVGNIREMHTDNVAGKAVSWTHDAAAKTQSLGLQVLDAEAAKKAKARVYTGLSIGGSNVKREMRTVNGKKIPVITSYRLNEVSLVDKPACPVATFTLVKRFEPKESPMKLTELLQSNERAAFKVRAAMPSETKIECGAVTYDVASLEKDAISSGTEALAALKAFLSEVLANAGDPNMWTIGDICEAMRYCYSARMGAQYDAQDAAEDAAVEMAAASGTLRKSETPADPPEDKPVEEGVDPAKAPEAVVPVPPVDDDSVKRAAVDLGPVLEAIANLPALIEPMVKALIEGSLTKAAGAHDLTQLESDVAGIKKAIESLPAPPPGRPVYKSLGHGVQGATGEMAADTVDKAIAIIESELTLDPSMRQQLRVKAAARAFRQT